jgi:ABC-type nitrate/sulfonate/bicarbonate transport system substrate-binding protein
LTGLAALGMGAPGIARAQEPDSAIRVGLVPNDDATSLLYAVEKRLFAAAGLDLQLDRATNGGTIAAAVAGGTYDIGKATLSSLFDAHLRGIPFTIIAPAGFYEKKGRLRPTGIMVSKSIDPADGKAFNDRVAAVASLNSLGRVSASAWIDQHGGDWRSVKFVELPMTEGAAAIVQGRVIAAEAAMPALGVALDTNTVQFAPMADAMGSAYLYSAWFTTRTWSSAHPRAAHSFAQVIASAAAYANSHPDETAPLVAREAKLTVATVLKMPRWTSGTALSAAMIQTPLEAAVRYGTIAHTFPASELIDPNAIMR